MMNHPDGQRPILNGWSLISSALCIEAYAGLGWDSVTIDMQHGWWDYAGALAAMAILHGAGKPAFVRVPSARSNLIGRYAGAAGIICR